MTVGDFRGLLDTTDEAQQNMDKFLEYTSQNNIQPTVSAYQDWAVNVQGLGKQFSFATVKAVALNVANAALNATISFGIGALVQLAITGIDKIIHAYDNLKEETEQLNEEYQSAVQEMESVQGELNTTRQKIDELENKGSLSLVEQNELDKLRETNIELEKQIANLETIAKAKQKEAVKSAVELYNTPNPDMPNIFSYNDVDSESAVTNNLSEQVNYLLESLYSLQHEIDNPDLTEKQKEKLQKRLDKYETMLGTGMEALSEIDLPAGYSESTDRIIAEIDEAMHRIRQYFGNEIPRDLLMERFGYTEEAKKAINELSEAEAEALTLYEGDIKSYTEFSKILAEIANSSGAATDALNNTNGETETFLDTLSKASSGIGSLNSAFEDFQENGTLSFSSLKKIQDEFKDVSGIEGYISQLSSAELTNEQFNAILSELTYKQLQTKIGTDNLTESNRALIEKMLEEQGVLNASEVATVAIARAKSDLQWQTEASKVATEEEVKALCDEALQAGLTEQQIYDLVITNILFNNTDLDVSQKIEALQQLGLFANWTAEQIANVGNIKKQDVEGQDYITVYDKDGNLIGMQAAIASSKSNDSFVGPSVPPNFRRNTSNEVEYGGTDSTSEMAQNKAEKAKDALEQYNKSIEDNAEKLSDAEKTYAETISDAYEQYEETVADIQDSLQELDEQEHLANLQHSIELVNQELEKFGNELSMLDSKLEMSFDGDYVYKLQNVGTQFKVAAEYGTDLRSEIDKLLVTMPSNADEANALADQLEALGDKYYENQRAIIEYRNEIADLRAEALTTASDSAIAQSGRLSDIVDRTFSIMERGSLTGDFFSMPLLSSIPKDAVEAQREENDRLIAEEKRYREEIEKVRKNATILQKQEDDAEREERRAELQQQLVEAREQLNETITNAHDTLLQTVSDIEESLNSSFKTYSDSVDGAVEVTKKAIDDIVNYANNTGVSINVETYVKNIEDKYNNSSNVEHKASGGYVSGNAIVNERGLESVILPNGTFRLLRGKDKRSSKMIANFPKGSQILNAKDTAELLRTTGIKDGDTIPQYASGSVSLSDLNGGINSLQVKRFGRSHSLSSSSNPIVNNIINEVQNAFDNINVSVDGVKKRIAEQFNDSKWSEDIAKRVEESFEGENSDGIAKDGILGVALRQSSWDSLPEEMQSTLSNDLSVTNETWNEWINNSENMLSAVELAKGSNVNSWDLLSPTMIEIVHTAGINTKADWDAFVDSNPLQALVLLVSSWDALKAQIQQYMDDMVTIATNGAEAIHAIQIESPEISQASWDNLQTVIANKIQEILDVIQKTFRDNSIDMNFNIHTSLPGNSQTNPQGGTAEGNALVETAKRYLGVPYVWGGTTPSGFDCSGLMQYVYRENGIDISRTTFTQIKEGTAVNKENLQPGDLVFFGSWEDPHHVGMYIGNGQYLHAPQTGDVVKISALDSRSDFVTGRRIINSYYTGTDGAKSGYATVGDGNAVKGDFATPAPELIFKKSGGAYLAGLNGTEIVKLNSGDTVVPYEETMRILKNKNTNIRSNKRFNSYAKGTGFSLVSLFGNNKNGRSNSSSNNKDEEENLNITTIDVPDGLGRVYSYMAWRTVTNTDSKQYRLREESGEHYDSEGYARIGGRYVLAMTSTFGGIGDYVNVYMADGTVIEGVIGDEKSQVSVPWDRNPANKWGHYNGQGVVEWITNWRKHDNPPSNGAVLYVENLGKNYFGDPAFAGESVGGYNSRVTQLILKALQDVVGTVSTNTNTGGMKVSGYNSLSGRQSSYDFDTPFTNLRRRADGGYINDGTTTIVNELGEESVEHTDGTVELLGKSPKLYKLRKGDKVYNAEDTAYLKTYLGDNFSRTKIHKLADGSTELDKDDEDKQDDSETEKETEKVAKTVAEKVIEAIEDGENLSEDSYEEEDWQRLYEVVEGLREDEKLYADQLDGILERLSKLDDIDKWLEETYPDLLNDRDLRLRNQYQDMQSEYREWQNDFQNKFINFSKSMDGITDFPRFFQFSMEAFNKSNEVGIEQARLNQEYIKENINDIKVERDLVYESFENAITASEKQRYSDALTELDNMISEQEDVFFSLGETIQDAVINAIGVRQGFTENALAYEQFHYDRLQRQYDDTENLQERQRLRDDMRDIMSRAKDILKQGQDEAHQNVMDEIYNSTDPLIVWLRRNIKIAEAVDPDGNLNSISEIERQKLINLVGEGMYLTSGGDITKNKDNGTYYTQAEFTEALNSIYGIKSEEAQFYASTEDSLESIDDTLKDLESQNIDERFDMYIKIQESLMDILQRDIDKINARYNALDSLYSFQQTLEQNKLDAQVELTANKELEQWLDPDTRKLLFNDDDYSEYISGINKINNEIEADYEEYVNTINNLKPEEWYREAEITAEWQRQLEIKQEELEVLQDEMEVAKKTLEYNNAAKERDTQIIMGNRVVNVADPERLHDLAMEREQAINQATLNQMTHANNADLRNIEALRDVTQTELNAYQQRVDMINEMTETERQAFADSLPSIESLGYFYTELAGQSYRFLQESLLTFVRDALNLDRIQLGDRYTTDIDYMAQKQSLPNNEEVGVLADETGLSRDYVYKMLDRNYSYSRNEKTATSKPFAQYYGNEHEEAYGSNAQSNEILKSVMSGIENVEDIPTNEEIYNMSQEERDSLYAYLDSFKQDLMHHALEHGGVLTSDEQGIIQRLDEILSPITSIFELKSGTILQVGDDSYKVRTAQDILGALEAETVQDKDFANVAISQSHLYDDNYVIDRIENGTLIPIDNSDSNEIAPLDIQSAYELFSSLATPTKLSEAFDAGKYVESLRPMLQTIVGGNTGQPGVGDNQSVTFTGDIIIDKPDNYNAFVQQFTSKINQVSANRVNISID